MLWLPQGTLLVMTPLSGDTGLQLSPYSARGLTQTYEPLTGTGGAGGNWLRRDVNGTLRSLADTRFRKYKSTITCRDGAAPCLDDAWIGHVAEVSCAFEFSYLLGAVPARPVVPGSVRMEGDVTFYRPILLCMVTEIKNSFAEWSAINDWSVSLEEC
jgi:hypothetical protein